MNEKLKGAPFRDVYQENFHSAGLNYLIPQGCSLSLSRPRPLLLPPHTPVDYVRIRATSSTFLRITSFLEPVHCSISVAGHSIS